MEILLIAPKDPKVASELKYLMGGENTYTSTLLGYPPQNVKYTHFQEALENGEITYTLWQKFLSLFIKTRILPIDTGYACIKLNKKFDLIHCHVYSLKVSGKIRPPIILGDSSSNYLFLRNYLHWHPIRIKLQYLLRYMLHKIIGVYDRELYLYNARKLIVFSQAAKLMHITLGANIEKIDVVPPGLPDRKIERISSKKTINILFAGVWFERKGGKVLLQAYNRIQKKYKNIQLTILGQLPKGIAFRNKRIKQYDYVSYDRLIHEFYAKADIFVLVPPKAEGFGMVVVEAASFGIPAIVSSVYALSEIVKDGQTGFVIRPGSVEELVVALEKLITNKKLREKMGKAAKERFMRKFWIEKTNRKLLKVYKEALHG